MKDIECLGAVRAAIDGIGGVEGFCVGKVIQNVWRCKDVNDLETAERYLQWLIGWMREREDK